MGGQPNERGEGTAAVVRRLTLTHEQRAQLFAGQTPRIAGEGKCPVEPGYVYRLSKRLELEVTAVRRTKGGGWSLGYTLSDRRDPARILKRTPSAQDFDRMRREQDEYGFPLEPSPEEIRRAAQESAYTSAPTSLSDAGEAVDQATQEAFSKQGQTIDGLREQKRREAWQREQDALSVYERFRIEWERAERLGTDVHREAAAVRRMVERMARKNARRAA